MLNGNLLINDLNMVNVETTNKSEPLKNNEVENNTQDGHSFEKELQSKINENDSSSKHNSKVEEHTVSKTDKEELSSDKTIDKESKLNKDKTKKIVVKNESDVNIKQDNEVIKDNTLLSNKEIILVTSNKEIDLTTFNKASEHTIVKEVKAIHNHDKKIDLGKTSNIAGKVDKKTEDNILFSKQLSSIKDDKDSKVVELSQGNLNFDNRDNISNDIKLPNQELSDLAKDKKVANNNNVKDSNNIQELVMVTDKRTDVQKLEVASQSTVNIQEQMANLKNMLKAEGNAQIVEKAHIVLNSADSGQIKLTLKPDNLGTVQININLEDQKLLGRIVVDNNNVKQVFDDNMSDLRDSMLKSGFGDTQLDVSVGHREASQGDDRSTHTKNNSLLKANSIGKIDHLFDENNVPLVANGQSSFRKVDITA